MRSHASLFALLSFSLLPAVGCQTQLGYAERDIQPLYDAMGNARSLALSTPLVRQTNRHPASYEPWYAGRRDLGPFVTSGSISISEEHSVTYTTDRQSVINGRVYDRYDETTQRRTYRDGAR